MELNQLNNTPNEEALFELLTLTCEVNRYGTKFYYNKEGKQHRIHGPAIIRTDGTEFWFKNDTTHREDGPAIIYPGGLVAYYINGYELTKREFTRWQKDNGIKTNK